MKKQALSIAIIFWNMAALCQQIPLHGVVTIHNSLYETGKVQYVPLAQVEEDLDRAQDVITDVDGKFKLMLIGVPEKERFTYQVKKEGLEVVNISRLEAVCGQKDTVKISMAKPKYIADFRNKVYNVGKTSAQKSLEKKQQQLLADYAAEKTKSQQNQERIGQLEVELAKVFTELTKVEHFANELADKYQRINLDDAYEKYREAFRLFQEGDLAGAKVLLQNTISHAETILAERQRIEVLKKEVAERDSLQKVRTEETMQELKLKADLHKAQYEWDSVRICYQVLIELDSMNVNNLVEVANYFYEINDQPSAIPLYEQALRHENGKMNRAVLLNNLGIALQGILRMTEAKERYEEALKTYRALAGKNPDAFLPGLAMSVNNMGALFSANHSYTEAEAAYREALKIRRTLAEKNPDAFLPDVAASLNSLGILLYANQSYTEAEAAYREALKIRRALAEKNPDAFLPDVAEILNNLGVLLSANQSYTEAEAAFREALKIKRALAEKNPDTFLPDVAGSLNNLGNLLSANQSFAEAEAAYREALKIYQTLVEKNPDAFLPYLATSLNNLGSLPFVNQSTEAEATYREALKIRRALAEKNPDAFFPDVAMSLYNLGNLLSDNHSYAEAEAAYREALKIRRALAEKNPDAFNLDVCTIDINLAIFYKDMLETSQDLRHRSEGLELLADAEQRLAIFPVVHPKVKDYRERVELWKDYFQNITPEELQQKSRLARVEALEKEISQETKPGHNVKWQKEIIRIVEGLLEETPGSQPLQNYLATACGSLAWYHLFARQPQEAEAAAKKGLGADAEEEWINTNLALAYLLQGKWTDAEAIYTARKDKPYPDGKRTWRQAFLEDLDALEAAGITHPDVAKTRALLKE